MTRRNARKTVESTHDRDRELAELLDAMLLQRRLVLFGRELRGADRVIFERRLLASRPASISRLSEELGFSYRGTRERVHRLESRLREAVRDPARGARRAA